MNWDEGMKEVSKQDRVEEETFNLPNRSYTYLLSLTPSSNSFLMPPTHPQDDYYQGFDGLAVTPSLPSFVSAFRFPLSYFTTAALDL